MARRGGLGKGLGALIPPGDRGSTATSAASRSSRSRRSRRTGTSRGTTSTRRRSALLADSIREVGVLQPVLVRPVGDGVRADRGRAPLAGRPPGRPADHPGARPRDRRRRRARAGPGREPPPRRASTRSRRPPPTSSSSRTSASPTTRSPRGWARSRATVTNTLRLLQLPPAIQRSCRRGKLAMGHARALLGTPDRAFQEQLAKQVVAEDLSVRATEEAVREHQGDRRAPADRRERRRPRARRQLRPPGPARARGAARRPPRDPGEDHRWAAARGKVVVEFSTLEDLERIYRLMTDGAAAPELSARMKLGVERSASARRGAARRTSRIAAHDGVAATVGAAQHERAHRRRRRPRPTGSQTTAAMRVSRSTA